MGRKKQISSPDRVTVFMRAVETVVYEREVTLPRTTYEKFRQRWVSCDESLNKDLEKYIVAGTPVVDTEGFDVTYFKEVEDEQEL